VQEAEIALGEPSVALVQASGRLRTGRVLFDEPTAPGAIASLDQRFLTALHAELTALEIQAEVQLGSPDSLSLSDRSLRGFAVNVSCPDADDSIHRQEVGLGGYRKLGCGVFVPEREVVVAANDVGDWPRPRASLQAADVSVHFSLVVIRSGLMGLLR
jgi:hypothetical protein